MWSDKAAVVDCLYIQLATLSWFLVVFCSRIDVYVLYETCDLSCSLRFRDNLLELRIYYESLTFSDVKQVPSYDLYSLLGKQHILLSPPRTLKLTCPHC